MPTSTLEWALTLSILPFYLWWGYSTGRKIGDYLMTKCFGDE